MKTRFRTMPWPIPLAILAALTACSPQDEANGSKDMAEMAKATGGASVEAGAATSEAGRPGNPIAQGRADVGDLTHGQIEVMYAAAVGQAKPTADHKAVCLDLATDARGVRRDPPDAMIAAVGKLVGRPALPASRCAFEEFPYAIQSKDRAMLYSVVVEPRRAGTPIKFWAYASYGNLGANGAEFVLKRGPEGWRAEPTGAQSIS